MNVSTINVKEHRKPEHQVNDIFINRWSPRAMSGESITDKELMELFEAGKWAPSSFNEQPWRFIYAKHGTPQWNMFFNLLGEFNQSWCKGGAVLVVIVSKKTFTHNGTANAVHSFDAGAAWENIALAGAEKGLVLHGMAGFDYEKARKDLHVPDDFKVEAMFVIGKPGNKDVLPEQMQEREVPSGRKHLKEIVAEGKFSF